MTLLNNLEKMIDSYESRIRELEEELTKLMALNKTKETNNKNNTS